MAEVAATWEPIDSIQPWSKNPRKNDGEPVDRVVKSIQRFGFSSPIVCREQDRRIIAGHTRWKAARKLGLTQVPVRFVPLDEAEAAALALADNKLTEITPWDDEALAGVLRDLEAQSVDLDGLGWKSEEIDALIKGLDPEPPAASDDVPEVQGEVHSRPGEMYALGPHRLWCGDARDLSAVLVGAGCIVFDPPWEDAVADWNPPMSNTMLVFGDGSTIGAQIAKRGAPAWTFAWDCVSSWWTPNRPLRRMKLCAWYGDVSSYNQHGFHYQPKNSTTGSRNVSNTRGSYEYEEDPRGRMLSDCYQKPITALHSDSEHRHEKPLEWMTMLIANTSQGVVGDPFGGSGTTILACAQTGRVARVIELDPRYCDVIRRRWTRYAKEAGIDPGEGALDG